MDLHDGFLVARFGESRAAFQKKRHARTATAVKVDVPNVKAFVIDCRAAVPEAKHQTGRSRVPVITFSIRSPLSLFAHNSQAAT